ncbi:uncharacterized protein BO96DRAFT_345287 [Aspergillus niger CBS 101883]|uniref:Contig An07c0320, genomic contig n=2 Tax=Aspergillus niger TaxID=5061 RepID=A2QPG1_ASPNC|nr:uncharacterized protein BO96DRAFT_345287 [Aspergillus niger CBS 101883]XP_059601083.1 uncharacterized protein An07g09325 [Aspergillus niger]PYH53496.1 hypothetical protein BO96DRAFT_345287 [Aspergillus niger CBS 101883]CAK39698.1 unnamed protein product [Aspergillus niger]
MLWKNGDLTWICVVKQLCVGDANRLVQAGKAGSNGSKDYNVSWFDPSHLLKSESFWHVLELSLMGCSTPHSEIDKASRGPWKLINPSSGFEMNRVMADTKQRHMLPHLH